MISLGLTCFEKMQRFGEIVVTDDYVRTTEEFFNTLNDDEKKFVYFLHRAILPFNYMFRDQNHRHANELITLFLTLYDASEGEMKEQIKVYLIYLMTNHGPFFLRMSSGNKRTPKKIGLHLITPNSFYALVRKAHIVTGTVDHLINTIFNEDEAFVADGSIEKSGNNFYAPGFTEEDYKKVPKEDQGRINAYFDINTFDDTPRVRYYSMRLDGVYRDQLAVTQHWLAKAISLAGNSESFDKHTVLSLSWLSSYFATGDEEYFRKHSISWLESKSRVAYTLGFIENYHDPKGVRGHAGGEVSVTTLDMQKITPVLLDIETKLPIDPLFRREVVEGTTLNASVNHILFSGGDYGPLRITAAYCLPNYNDIRAKHGSRQIIYKSPGGMDKYLDPALIKQLRSTRDQAFIDSHDPEDKLADDMWDVHVLLHETVGHASGKLHKHTFTRFGEKRIGGVDYREGDVIDVTDENLPEFIPVDLSSLEELRADINALYMSIAQTDILVRHGVFKDWATKLGMRLLQEKCIEEMASVMFRRYQAQSEDMTAVKGSHARGNSVIGNWLIENRGIKLVSETKGGFTFYGFEVIDYDAAFEAVRSLVNLVQEIKSTGNGDASKFLFEKYTTYPVTIAEAREIKKNLDAIDKKLVGDMKVVARVYPNYQIDQAGKVYLGERQDIFEQNRLYQKLMVSMQ